MARSSISRSMCEVANPARISRLSSESGNPHASRMPRLQPSGLSASGRGRGGARLRGGSSPPTAAPPARPGSSPLPSSPFARRCSASRGAYSRCPHIRVCTTQSGPALRSIAPRIAGKRSPNRGHAGIGAGRACHRGRQAREGHRLDLVQPTGPGRRTRYECWQARLQRSPWRRSLMARPLPLACSTTRAWPKRGSLAGQCTSPTSTAADRPAVADHGVIIRMVLSVRGRRRGGGRVTARRSARHCGASAAWCPNGSPKMLTGARLSDLIDSVLRARPRQRPFRPTCHEVHA
jgi:hypothetical protein